MLSLIYVITLLFLEYAVIDTEESIEKNTCVFITFVLLFLFRAKLLQKEDNRKFLMSIIYVYNSFLCIRTKFSVILIFSCEY